MMGVWAVESLAKKLEKVKKQRDKFRLALRNVVTALGPYEFGCGECCDACRRDGSAALDCASKALRSKK